MLTRSGEQKRVKASLRLLSFVLVMYFSLSLFSNVFAVTTNEENASRGSLMSVSEYVDTQLDDVGQFLYLSDIKYSYGKAYGNILYDKTSSNTKFNLRVNGQATVFERGIWAHAPSTVDYNLTNYKDYSYFTAYYGVNATSNNNGNGVKFYVYTSVDGKNWDLKTDANPQALKSGNNSVYVKIDIRDANYLRLYASDNGGNGNDHAVWADAKLIKEGYNEFGTMSVEDYDNLIKSKVESKDTDGLSLLLLQRDFVDKAGQYTIKTFITSGQDEKVLFDWFFNNERVLKLYLVGGRPAGSYLNSLRVFSRLCYAYGDDLKNDTITQYGNKLSDVYLTMMIASSLEHSGSVYFWANSKELSDPLVRYQIFKDLHHDNLIVVKDFESLTVEEMRFVINTVIDDEEIKWLNNYTRTVKGGATGPYSYIRYTFGYNYTLPKYYSEENYEAWNNKYNLSDWGVTYGRVGFPKLWIVFEEGSVCGGLSKTGSCVWGSYKGLPNTCVCQPGHCAYIYCSFNSNGDAVWGLGNDVSGWAQSGKTEHLNTRMMNDWGNNAVGWSASYILLAQAAQNEYEKYEEAQQILMLARVYGNNPQMLEKLYLDALECENINYEAWEGLVKLYLADSTKTEAEYYDLAEKIANALTFYPRPMYDLISILEPKFVSGNYIAMFTTLKNDTLTRAYNCNGTDTLQQTAVKQVAKALLGWYDSNIASFSFDGENAGSIVLASQFGTSDVEWNYSLDGGKTWTQTGDKKHKLTTEELESITAENDIKVHIMGLSYDEKNIFTININPSAGLPKTLYANDLENKLIGATDNVQWRYNDEDEWTLYKNEVPDLTGEKKVQVRLAATGTYLCSNIAEYQFSADSVDEKKSYVSIDCLSIDSFSSENVRSNRNEFEYARNAIDGNINTWWHTSRVSTTDQKFIVIKTNEPKYISEIEYIPKQDYQYGVLKDAVISVSVDGENWTEVKTVSNLEVNNDTKVFDLDESVYAQYIKIQALKTYQPNGDYNYFLNAAMINVFEDLTKVMPTAEIEYSRNETTALSVTAKLVNPSTDITVTNNNGKDSYTFDNNGTFTFYFEDKNGNIGRADAKVDWIIDYSFSFDGEDPYTLILSNKYKDLIWEYSIDGGNTWNKRGNLVYKLNSDEIKALNAQDDLKFRVLNSEEPEIITIDIKEGSNLPQNLYANDWENKVIGVTDKMEWRYVGDTYWSSYKNSTPSLAGDKEVEIRYATTGTTLHGNAQTYTFTQDEEDIHKVYIPIDNLSIVDYSSQGVRPERNEYEYATNAIDGNINTWWHTNHTVTNDERYIVIELKEPKSISQMQYLPRQNYAYGLLKNGTIYASLDNENWTNVYEIENLARDYTLKTFEFDEAVYAKYIRFQCNNSYDPQAGGNPAADWFINAAIINLYEDTADENKELEFEVEYDIKTKTNSNVTAKLVCLNDKVTITNNYGNDTYTFEDNGSFTFEYVDSLGRDGIVVAKVDWIDKTAPKAEVKYSTKEATNKEVKATIKFDEKIEVLEDIEYKLNEERNEVVLTLEDNVGMCFNVKDEAGNETCVEILVDWIDKTAPKATVEYSTKALTNKDVVATITLDEDVEILNDDVVVGKNTDSSYTILFESNTSYDIRFKDKAGNEGTVQVSVDWIDKENPTAEIEYSTKTLTEENVVVKLKPSEDIEITNNDGKDTYTFEDNGEFTFEFKDKAGNIGKATAIVSWIRKIPNITLSYDNEKITNKDVTVTLVTTDDITVTNNDGSKTYTFKENGEFKFEYVDKFGVKEEITARVDWIDKTAPTANIIYSTTEVTLNPVTATVTPNEKVTFKDNITQHVFTENGEYTFEFTDEAGNVGYATATVSWIRKIPGLNIKYNITELTNNDVIATLETEENIKIQNNDGLNTYTFIENGEFTFICIDEFGVEEEITARVDWIDKTIPTAEVSYSSTEKTNKDVVATLRFSKKVFILNEDVDITENEDGTYSITFTENGYYGIRYKDEAGNESSTYVAVDWINKETPTAEFKYSTKEYTRDSVTVTLVPSKKVYITNNNGLDTYTFNANGEFTFEFVDEYGNVGSAKVSVDWIVDETKVDLEYSTKNKTNKDVEVKLVSLGKVQIVNNNNKDTYIFTENGSFVFEYIDEYGYSGTITAVVDFIDKVLPIEKVEYSNTNKTNKDVVATLTFSEDVTILNEDLDIVKNSDGTYSITFTENGYYNIRYKDEAGNEASTDVAVDWINKNTPTAEIEYSNKLPTAKPVTVTLKPNTNVTIINNDGKDTYTFNENGEFTFEFVDEYGNVGSATASVDNIVSELEVKLEYSTETLTNKDVIATVVANRNITIVNNDSSNTYVFTENGEFEFKYIDEYGFTGTIIARVSWIEKVKPNAKVEYSNESVTNTDVYATISFDKEVEIVNIEDLPIVKQEDGSYTLLFKSNGEYIIDFVDAIGNTNTVLVKVDWIDRTEPNVKVVHNSKDKTVELTTDKDVTISSKEELSIKQLNDRTFILSFTKNGKYNIELKDKAGNISNIEILVDWIKINKPEQKPIINEGSNVTEIDYDKVFGNGNNISYYPTFVGASTSDLEVDEDSNTNEREDKEFKSSYAVIKILNTNIKDARLINNKLSMTEKLLNKVGKQSEYFELYLEDFEANRVELEPSQIEVRIKLDPDKKFLGIYRVCEDDSLELIEYELIDGNEILVDTEDLGKFVISYEEETREVEEDEIIYLNKAEKNKDLIDTINKTKKIYGIAIMIAIGLVIGIVIFMIKKKYEEDQKY